MQVATTTSTWTTRRYPRSQCTAPLLRPPRIPPPEFFAQLIETMKNIQVPQQPSKIVVESRDYEETIDLAKLQNGMLQLFYATGDINWDDGVAKNIKVATFLQGFLKPPCQVRFRPGHPAEQSVHHYFSN
jgi:hypothetical protein